MKQLWLRGPNGSGKSTLGKLIAKSVKESVFVSSGALLREQMGRRDDIVRQELAKGNLADSDLVLELMTRRYKEIKNAGSRLMIVDGFPRKLEEVWRWEKLVGPPHHVISLSLDDKSVVDRLMNREVCDSCGASYNSFSNEFLRPIVPRIRGECDFCTNGVLSKRADDSSDAILRRLRIFHENENDILNAVRVFPNVELIECDATKGIAAFEQIAGRISNIYS